MLLATCCETGPERPILIGFLGSAVGEDL
jgi:hypothetical protein